MDANQFDELVARLAEGPSRRDALKGVIGGALASIGIGAATDGDDAEAKGKGKGKGRKNRGGKGRGNNGRGNAHSQGGANAEKKKHKHKKKKKCKGGKKHCGSKKKCFDLQTNHDHCGNCGTACADDEECIAGICTIIT